VQFRRRLVAATLVLVLAATLVPTVGHASAARPHPATGGYFQDLNATSLRPHLNSALTVSVEIADITGLQSIDFTFCSITAQVCFLPTGMVPEQAGSHWYQGTTLVLSKYTHMAVGTMAGFNITVRYTNSTNASIPASSGGQPVSFANITAVQAIAAGDYYFEVVVAPPAFGVSGTVTNATTGAPVAGASVSLDTTPASTGTTDAHGAFSWSGVPVGNYTLTVSASGYATRTEPLQVSSAPVVQNVSLSSSKSGGPPSSGSGGGSSDTFFGLPATDAFIGIGLAGAVVVAVLVVAMRPKRGGKRRAPVASGEAESPPAPPPSAGG
jgi:hypothetical protein